MKRNIQAATPFHVALLDTTFTDMDELVFLARQIQMRMPTCCLVLLTQPDHLHLQRAREVADRISFKQPLLLRRPLRKASLLWCMRATKMANRPSITVLETPIKPAPVRPLAPDFLDSPINTIRGAMATLKPHPPILTSMAEEEEEDEGQEENQIEPESDREYMLVEVGKHKTWRILVVEDNAVNRKVVIAQLKRLGYVDVDMAMNGLEAVEKVKRNEDGGYALIFMDIAMPVMDGLEATHRIRNLQGKVRNIPIIALTASVSSRDRTRCIECGMSDFLMKPLRNVELAAMLRKWLPKQIQ